jgi:hypothetical protein
VNTKSIIIAVAAVVALGALAYTQLPKGGPDTMSGMDHSAMAPADASASTKSYEKAMADLMAGMNAPMTGKPDVDFMQGMIPHHQLSDAHIYLSHFNELTEIIEISAVFLAQT